MLSLYHAPTTRSFRIQWLLDELGTEYQLKEMNFYNNERHEPEFRAISPMGSIPVIVDDGFALIESAAIINYILRKYGNGRFTYPDGSKEAALVDQWMCWSESLFAIHQRIYWDHCAPFPAGLANPVPHVGIDAKQAALGYLGMLEQALGDDGYMVGDDLTGADFMLCFPLYLASLEGWLVNHPKTRAYIERIACRPKFAPVIADTVEVVRQFEALKAHQAAAANN
ncbi:glutathione S-transferase family protein [Pseudomonas umsongensis]|uniref:glutathione S-transferase family protein n=1 Tax=Pseudomonas umsongensis TaxID=198618 RepID=UPI00200B2A3C|nr:glutathione S-transferase family protein [Pseudomonas umsongensis]MCK8683276.1 glutathione S-transferase family protein [Pseudomonas umsongensis]